MIGISQEGAPFFILKALVLVASSVFFVFRFVFSGLLQISVVRVPMVEPPPDAENSTVLAERSLPPSVEYGIFSVLGIAVLVRFRRSISLVLWYPRMNEATRQPVVLSIEQRYRVRVSSGSVGNPSPFQISRDFCVI